MKEFRYITYKQVIAFNKEICKRYKIIHSLINKDTLESAVGNSYFFLEEEGYLHGSMPELAAALCFKIAKNHPFLDGNKRTAAATALAFLELNDYDIDFEEYGDEDTEFHRKILSFVGNETDLDDLKEWFIKKTKKQNPETTEAMEDVKKKVGLKKFNSAQEMLDDLHSDDVEE